MPAGISEYLNEPHMVAMDLEPCVMRASQATVLLWHARTGG